jgi:two-component system CheB/CheR fusion protein
VPIPQQNKDAASAIASTRFQQLLEAMLVPAYFCDRDGRIVFFNESAATLWGRRPELNDATDRYCGSLELRSPDGERLPHDQCWMALALRDDRAYEGRELTIVRPDGSRRAALAYASPVHDDEGRLIAGTCVLVDITARVEAQRAQESALQITEANFRAFFDSPAVGAVQANADGRFVRVNDRYCEITGYSREELLSMGPFDLDHPDERDADLELVRKAIADPAGVYDAEKRYVRKDGSIGWVHVAANMLRDESGRATQSAAIAMDITERKLAEQALKDTDRTKDEFLATLAHELRTPLAPLSNAVELLRHPGVPEPYWCRQVIERQVSHLSRLVDDLLDVSRITRDMLELRRTRVALADVLNRAVEASRPLLERREQKLEVTLTPEDVHIDGDLVRLTQVFTNLLTNAAKFSESASTIRLSAVRDGDDVRVGVLDSGIGIAAEELSRIFDKFYQSPRRGDHFVGGLGIGLALVRRLVELHGGTVEARSAGLGQGSEFIVRLPIKTALRSQSVPAQVSQLLERSGKRVLIVDDNADSADSLGRLLERMGHEAVTEYDGEAALERAKTYAADVIFLDLGMPGLDGFEVCRRLREQPAPKRPSIVALTGWSREEDRERSRDAGFDSHVVKPIDEATIERVLGY